MKGGTKTREREEEEERKGKRYVRSPKRHVDV